MRIAGKTVAFLVAAETAVDELMPLWDGVIEAGGLAVAVGASEASVARVRLPGGRGLPTALLAGDARASMIDALVIPGGFGVDELRRHKGALALVREMETAHKPIGVIGRGVRVLAGAGVLAGRHVAAPEFLAPDVLEAGGVMAVSPWFKEGSWITGKGAQEAGLVAEALVCWLEQVPVVPPGRV